MVDCLGNPRVFQQSQRLGLNRLGGHALAVVGAPIGLGRIAARDIVIDERLLLPGQAMIRDIDDIDRLHRVLGCDVLIRQGSGS